MSWIKLTPSKNSKEILEELKKKFPTLNDYTKHRWIRASLYSLLEWRLVGTDANGREGSTKPEIFTGEPWKALKNKPLLVKSEHGSLIIEVNEEKSYSEKVTYNE